MRFVLIVMMSIFAQSAHTADYESAQRLEDGDVISAEVMNDILNRVELTLKPIIASELVGSWSVTQIYCKSGATVIGASDYCQDDDVNLSGMSLTNSIVLSREDTLNITENSDGTINWTATDYDVLFFHTAKDSMRPNVGGLTHVCTLLAANVMGCLLDPSITHPVDGRLRGFVNVNRTSPTQIIFNLGPFAGGGMNFVVANKVAVPPLAPTSLSVTSSSNGNQLSWTAGDDTATSYQIMSKEGATDDFAEAGTSSSISFTDSSSSRTRQYRVFAINDNGTSIGSNVVSLD